MVVYYTNHLKETDLTRSNRYIIDWLKQMHQHTKPYASIDDVTKDEIKDIKRNKVKGFLCSGFQNDETKEIKQPDWAPRKKTKGTSPIRDYIVLDYDDFQDFKTAEMFISRVKEMFKDVDYALYPSVSYPTKPNFRLVIPVKPHLNHSNYGAVAHEFINMISFDTGDIESNTNITHMMNAPFYLTQDAKDEAHFNEVGTQYDVSEIIDNLPESAPQPSKQKQSKKPQPATNIKSETLNDALDKFLDNDNVQAHLNDSYEYFWRLTESVAMALINDTITEDFAREIMTRVAMGNEEWEQANQEELQTQIQKLEQDESRHQLVQPITSYLPIVEEYKNVKNLPQLLKAMLPDTFMPDSELKPYEVAREITRLFEFAILPTKGQSDAENVAIFNPLTGAWEHDEDQFIAMMTVIKPGVTSIQAKNIMMEWGAHARFDDKVIEPYNKTQFLLFKNGILDITTLKLHSFTDPIVRECQFTRRHKINLNWHPNPQTKNFECDRPDGGDWDIHRFLNGYGHNQDHLKEYFLFGLSLGLFAGHNTAVHFDIQGSSRFGKTTLALIYENLFSSRISKITYSQLNQQFPLTNYDPDNAIIWVNECNIGAEPLNDEFGTPFYDGMADNEVRLPVKHAGDLILNDPPQMFIDGTQFIQATEIHTGPAGRTLAYKLPEATQEDLDKIYSLNIKDKFKDEAVMQDLVYHMIQAFKNVVPEPRQKDFKLNLAMKRDLELLPKEARDWRHEFVNANSNIKRWFDEELEPFLELGKPLHNEMLYEMYATHVERMSKTGNDRRYAVSLQRFEKNLDTLYDEYELTKEYQGSIDKKRPNQKPRKTIKHPDKTGIDWTSFEDSYLRPKDLITADGKPDLFGKRVPGWYILKRMKEDD